jgi:hypothetical protein
LLENSDAPCDTGSLIPILQDRFPQYRDELSRLDPAWPSKTGAYEFTQSANHARGQTVLRSLYHRPEKVIAVVSHAGFLRTAISQCHYANADYRIFNFEEKMVGREFRLREWERTEEKGGAMGRSWKGIARVEEGDFPEEPDFDEGMASEETPPPTPLECLGRKEGKI